MNYYCEGKLGVLSLQVVDNIASQAWDGGGGGGGRNIPKIIWCSVQRRAISHNVELKEYSLIFNSAFCFFWEQFLLHLKCQIHQTL